jgi:hypothetical protein
MKGIFARGVNFYEDIEQDFPNPVLKNTNIANVNVFDTDDSSIVVGEESLDAQSFTHQIAYQADRREYGHATWFCFSDGEVQESFKRACSCQFSHYYNSAPNTTTTG